MATDTESLDNLADVVFGNLRDQHDWTNVAILKSGHHLAVAAGRPLLSGLPPRRLYIHPDEQVEILQTEDASRRELSQTPEMEWVVPVHITEKLTLGQFASIFDTIETLPPDNRELRVMAASDGSASKSSRNWRGSARQKRIVLAAVHDDSTISYYVVHDGIVKPRQN